MSTESTIYDVKLVYTMQDTASAGLKSMASHAKQAADHTDALSSGFTKLAGVFGAFAGLHEAEKAFIGFNREMENIHISMAAMLQSNELYDTFEGASEGARKLTAEFQRFAVTSPVTTKELAQFANGVAVAVAQAKGGTEDIKQFTEQGVIAAKAFGANADYAALEITEGIQRGMTSRQRFLKQLVATQHMDEATFNSKTAEQRMEVLRKALSSPAMKAAATAFGESFEGVTSTLKDNIEISLGKVGLPLFKAVTHEIQSWNEWIAKNDKGIHEIGDSVSGGLVKGFEVVKGAVQAIVAAKTELMLIAGAFAVLKGATFISGAASGIAGLATSIGSLSGGFVGLIPVVGQVALAMGAVYLASNALVDAFASQRDMNRRGEAAGINQAIAHDARQVAYAHALGSGDFGATTAASVTAYKAAIQRARDMGVFKEDLGVDWDKYSSVAKRMDIDQEGKGGRLLDEAVKYFARNNMAELAMREGKRFNADGSPKRTEDKHEKPPQVHINIARVQVDSGDPDRFVMGLVDLGRRALARPTQALTVPRI